MLPHCPMCGSNAVHPRGSVKRPDRYQCSECQQHFTDKGSPKVLVFDIETLPIIGTFWDTGKQYIGHQNILEDYVVLSWSAKALFHPETIGDILTPEEVKARLETVFMPDPKPAHNADYRIVKRMWKLLDEADAVITQNGKKFDAKKLNTRFIYYGLPPPRPFHHIDTLEAANSTFAPSSASLAYMMKFLNLERKMDTDYELWLKCQIGEPQALQYMYDYGLHDTVILEDYYARIRAWIPRHPNFSAYTHKYGDLKDGGGACHVCRNEITAEDFYGEYRSPLGNTYDAYRCPHCGAVGRKSKKNPGTVELRQAG